MIAYPTLIGLKTLLRFIIDSLSSPFFFIFYCFPGRQ